MTHSAEMVEFQMKKSAAKIKPVLEKWMQEAELKYADRLGLIHFLLL